MMSGQAAFSILEEQMDEKYEPTQQEIKDYAEWLGIAEGDTHLLWIARQGLKTPLPKPWRPCEASSGEIFFYNPVTGASQWDHPCDQELRQLYLQEKKKQKEREEREKDKDGKEETTSVSSIGEEVEEKTPPPTRETEKPKPSAAEGESPQKRLSFSDPHSSGSPDLSCPESDKTLAAELKNSTGDLKKMIPERPNKPPPAKLRPPRPKTTSDMEEAFCKSPSPARARRCHSPPAQSPGPDPSQQSPGSKFTTPSPPSPPTPGLSAVLKAEVREDDISFWSNLENGEETLCQGVTQSKGSENGGSLEISSLTAVLEPFNSGENEVASGKASPAGAEACGSAPHTTLTSLQCSLTALEPSSSGENPSGLSTRAEPDQQDGVLHNKTSLVELAQVNSRDKENQMINDGPGPRPLKDITNEIQNAKLPTTPRSLASSAVDVAAMQRLQWELKEEQEERAALDRQLAEVLTAASMEQLAHSSTKAALRNSQRDVQRLQTQLRFKDSEVEHLESELQKCQSELAMLTAQKKQAESQLKAHQVELTRCKSKPQKLQKPSRVPSPRDSQRDCQKDSLAAPSPFNTDDSSEFLQRRRRELRLQHAELEEERKQWRQEARQCQGEPSEDLVRSRVVLDARAITLNKKISEYRALQRALTSGALQSPNA